MSPYDSALKRTLNPVLCCMIALIPPVLLGQNSGGEIRLEVKDSSGAAMEAAGKLVPLATGVNRNFQTDAQGRAVLSGLTFGRYRIEISKQGFTTQTMVLNVESSRAISRTITMPVGTQGFSVDVVGMTPLSGGDRTRDEIPSPVQAATDKDIEASGALEHRRLSEPATGGVST